MAGICDTIIAKGIELNCDNPLVMGMESNGLIINRSQIDFAQTVFDTDNKNIIKTLVLKTGAKAYPVVQQGATPFTGAKTSLVVGTYFNSFTNEIPLLVLDNGPDVAANVVDKLANGSFVLILKNVHKGDAGKSEYQVYGYYQGLHASAIENEKYSTDTNGGWLCTMQETQVPKSALFYFNTDSETTETQFKTLSSAV
jgi:hypothetical protein